MQQSLVGSAAVGRDDTHGLLPDGRKLVDQCLGLSSMIKGAWRCLTDRVALAALVQSGDQRRAPGEGLRHGCSRPA